MMVASGAKSPKSALVDAASVMQKAIASTANRQILVNSDIS